MKVRHVVLSLFLAIVGYITVVVGLMHIGAWYHGGYTYYDGPVGIGLGVGGALVGLAIPWVVRSLTKRSISPRRHNG